MAASSSSTTRSLPAEPTPAPSAVPRLLRPVARSIDDRGDLLAVAVMRMLFGIIVIRHLWPDLTADVLPVERFHVPWWSWLPVPAPEVYRALTVVGALAGLAMVVATAVGVIRPAKPVAVAARASSVVAFGVVTYLVFVDMTGFAHNRGFLVWMLFGLVLVPAGRWRQQPLWPVTLLQLVVSSVYLTSGGTKLLDPDWRGGLVLWDRVNRYAHLIPFDGWFADLLTSRSFHYFLAPAAIAVELFLAFGLWNRRTRLVAIWVAIVFHGSIELAASVQTFSYSALAALLIWVTPTTRDRTLITGSTRLVATVRWLDWLGRFRIVDAGVADGPTTLVDRDGTQRTGRDATLTALSRLPLLFFVVAPLLAFRRVWPRQELVA